MFFIWITPFFFGVPNYLGTQILKKKIKKDVFNFPNLNPNKHFPKKKNNFLSLKVIVQKYLFVKEVELVFTDIMKQSIFIFLSYITSSIKFFPIKFKYFSIFRDHIC